MHESDQNRLAKRRMMLLLASSDMWHAEAAANAWAERPKDDELFRVLQTGMIVIYARPFSRSSFVRLNKHDYRPADNSLARAHDLLIDMRDQAAAHTDEPKRSGRTAEISFPLGEEKPGIGETYVSIARSSLPALLELFRSQKIRFELESEKIRLELRRS